MIDTDFIIFSYLPPREILKIFEFYFIRNVQNIKNPKVLRLQLCNQLLIAEIEEKYPIKIKCEYVINAEKIDWYMLSENPDAIHLLEQNSEKIDWNWVSRNPNVIHLLSQKPEKINWSSLSRNPNALHLLLQNLDKNDWKYLSKIQMLYIY